MKLASQWVFVTKILKYGGHNIEHPVLTQITGISSQPDFLQTNNRAHQCEQPMQFGIEVPELQFSGHRPILSAIVRL